MYLLTQQVVYKHFFTKKAQLLFLAEVEPFWFYHFCLLFNVFNIINLSFGIPIISLKASDQSIQMQ